MKHKEKKTKTKHFTASQTNRHDNQSTNKNKWFQQQTEKKKINSIKCVALNKAKQ